MMEREYPEMNPTFVPKTISNCMALANESTSVVVCIVDLKERNYIWADIESNRALPTLENAANRTAEVVTALIHGTKMSIYELLSLHVQARGELVRDRAAADLTLDWESLVSDYARVATYMLL
jgi:hypothetical protein